MLLANFSSRSHDYHSVAATTSFPRCQCQHYHSVAAITSHDSLSVAMSSSQLVKALLAGEVGGREINTKPSLYCSQQYLLHPTVPALHTSVRASIDQQHC